MGGESRRGAMTGGGHPTPHSIYTILTNTTALPPTLKTVMERCEGDKDGVYLPKVDREGKCLGDTEYSLPSPPERDMDDYTSYKETHLSQLSIDGGYDGSQTSLTRSELEQYSRGYEDVIRPIATHSQQPSYAQSEGYHSYVSSTDSTTPFLDRLREESDGAGRESCASSGSSSETLKWHGSLSDVSGSSAGGGTHHHQHIAHSSRVPMPQRHHSESVLYLGADPWNTPHLHTNNQINAQMRRLFPVSTYEPTPPRSPPKLSVAERVCEIERQQQRVSNPEVDKRSRITDHASLKAIQKKALLSFYERHHSAWKSEPQLTASGVPPQPPPRPQPPPSSRRSSSASDYAGSINREARTQPMSRSSMDNTILENSSTMKESRHQHSSSCGSLSVLGPMIVGPAISVDDWVPARPPKKPHLRAAYPLPPPRVPSPDLPPPSPPPLAEDEVFYSDEPLPPPPPEDQLQNHLGCPERPPYRSRNSKYERAMNASLSLDNLTKPNLRAVLLHSKSQDPPETDVHYENGSEIKRNLNNSCDHFQRNGFSPQKDKYNERYVQNRIEYKQPNYCDPHKDAIDKRNYMDLKRYSTEKKLPLEPPMRPSLLSPPLPDKGKRPSPLVGDQPRSLDSNLAIMHSHNQINRPGPQTPIHKKNNGHILNTNGSTQDAKPSYKNLRDNFVRSNIQNDMMEFRNGGERQSLRFSTTTQKLLVNGKIANAIHNGKISPPSRKANLVRTPSDVVRKISYSSGIHHAEPIAKFHSELLSKSPPVLPPQCPPTSHQLSQSKASYLSYRREPREKGLPQGSYKRTMSPTGGRIIDTLENGQDKEPDIFKVPNDPPVEKPPAVPTASPVVPSPTPVEKEPKEEVAEDKEEEVCHGQVHEGGLDKEPLSKTLPRNYSLSVAPAKRTSRPPRAQSDPTSTAKSDKKSVSASTQDNLDEVVSPEEKSVATVGRTHSEVGDRAKEKSRMSDASSQTTPVPSPPPPQLVATVPARRHLQEEIECEQLSRDLASQLSPSHRLHGILVPGPEVKRSTDYVSGLFRMDVVPRSRNSPVSTSTTQQINGINSDSLPGSNAYFTTSECKARLMSLVNTTSQSEPSSMTSLQQKKEELMQRLTRKLSVLKSESVAVSEETAVNEALGTTVTERVERVARPQEAAKFRLHVKEVGHITSLLLGLSGRLARAENALLTMPQDHQDRKTLESKRDKLLEQLNEAKQLKANIDKRSESVSSMLYNYLTGEEYTDYDHFINMKSKLLVDSREIAEKIQLGEEQLAALKETLDQVR